MLTETAQKKIQEDLSEMYPRVENIKFMARSGGPNEEAFIKSRCEQILKLLKEIEGKV